MATLLIPINSLSLVLVINQVIRRSGEEEKILVLAKKRVDHVCETSLIVTNIVLWEGVNQARADNLYKHLSTVCSTTTWCSYCQTMRNKRDVRIPTLYTETISESTQISHSFVDSLEYLEDGRPEFESRCICVSGFG